MTTEFVIEYDAATATYKPISSPLTRTRRWRSGNQFTPSAASQGSPYSPKIFEPAK